MIERFSYNNIHRVDLIRNDLANKMLEFYNNSEIGILDTLFDKIDAILFDKNIKFPSDYWKISKSKCKKANKIIDEFESNYLIKKLEQ